MFSISSNSPTSNGIQRVLKGEHKGVQLKIINSEEVPIGETLTTSTIVYEFVSTEPFG